MNKIPHSVCFPLLVHHEACVRLHTDYDIYKCLYIDVSRYIIVGASYQEYRMQSANGCDSPAVAPRRRLVYTMNIF